MKKGLLIAAGICCLAAIGWVTVARQRPAPSRWGAGFFKDSCVTLDERLLGLGGDHAAAIDVQSGGVLARIPSVVTRLGCEAEQVQVIGAEGAWTLPGLTPVSPIPAVQGEPLTLTTTGSWLSKDASRLFVTPPEGTPTAIELPPSRFGAIGLARNRPSPSSFAIHFGGLLDDGRLLLAAGWTPSHASDDVPWGFFALDLGSGATAALTVPLKSDEAVNTARFHWIAASKDGMRMALAAHDGTQLVIAQYDQGANVESKRTVLSSQGAPSALAVSEEGARVAIGSEPHGAATAAQAWVLDQDGATMWHQEFPKTVIGVHFLSDGSLIVVAADGRALRVELPSGVERWRVE